MTEELTISLHLALVHLNLNVYTWPVVLSRDTGELRRAQGVPDVGCGSRPPGVPASRAPRASHGVGLLLLSSSLGTEQVFPTL